MNSPDLPNPTQLPIDPVAEDGPRALQVLRLPKDAAILDVGTGKGNFAVFLAKQGFQVLTGEPATDTSYYARQNWEQKAQEAGVRDQIRFEAFDAGAMPFEAGTFDAVFFFGVLHHIPEELRAPALAEALRVAKQNGTVVFFEPRTELLEMIWANDPGHPLPANPSAYLRDSSIRERKLDGKLMEIFIYNKRPPRE